MPMFEYRCGDCGNEFEELILSRSAEASVNCPKCGSGDVHKKISSFSGMTGGSGSGEAAPAPPSCGFQ